MRILIVDDLDSNRVLLKKMLSNHEELFYAKNGLEAIELFSKQQPDLILMDILMPEMDGIEATRLIRQQCTEKWVPIIILSALADEKSIVSGLQIGADDYLTKPFNQEILHAKIASIHRTLALQNNILQANQALKEYQCKNEQEHAFTKDIFDHLIKNKELSDVAVDFWLHPSKCFSGDLISFKRINPERTYFIVADSMGHGLAASISTIIVNQVFQSMTEKNFLVSSIAKEINHRLRTDIPSGRFVALAVGILDNHNKVVEIWNGGLPEIMVINKSHELIHGFKSQHVFSGVMADNEFDEKTEIWQWTEACELFAYSDGVTDVLDKDNNAFGEHRLQTILLQQNNINEPSRIDSLKANLLAFMDKEKEQDDISCLSIHCD